MDQDRGDSCENGDDDSASSDQRNVTEEDTPLEVARKQTPPPVPPRPKTGRGARKQMRNLNETMAYDGASNRYRSPQDFDAPSSHLDREPTRSSYRQPDPNYNLQDRSPAYTQHGNESIDRMRFGDGPISDAPETHRQSATVRDGTSSNYSEYENVPYTSRGERGVGSSSSRRQYAGEASTSCGANSSWTHSYTEQVSREEMQIGEQARLLLNLFIQERVENTPVEPIIRDVCQADKQALVRSGLSDESLSDIALTLRRIGDDMSQNVELNNFIEQVPIDSTRDIFMKVCLQIFRDGNLNWGRVVALFYFAYRLVMRTATRGLDSLPWVRNMLSWAVEFIVKNVAKWILSVGGWKMIKDYMNGVSSQTWVALTLISAAAVIWAVFKKD